MNNLSLISTFLLEEFFEHVLEALVAELTNFFTDGGGNGGELFGLKDSSTSALSAWKAFLVHLRAIALDASDFFNTFFVFFRDKKLAISLGIRDGSCHLASLCFSFSG
jgi:hypothetical protein